MVRRRSTLDNRAVSAAPYVGTVKNKESMKRALTDIHVCASQLLDFQTLNRTGYRKLTKKLPRDMADEVRCATRRVVAAPLDCCIAAQLLLPAFRACTLIDCFIVLLFHSTR